MIGAILFNIEKKMLHAGYTTISHFTPTSNSAMIMIRYNYLELDERSSTRLSAKEEKYFTSLYRISSGHKILYSAKWDINKSYPNIVTLLSDSTLCPVINHSPFNR